MITLKSRHLLRPTGLSLLYNRYVNIKFKHMDSNSTLLNTYSEYYNSNKLLEKDDVQLYKLSCYYYNLSQLRHNIIDAYLNASPSQERVYRSMIHKTILTPQTDDDTLYHMFNDYNYSTSNTLNDLMYHTVCFYNNLHTNSITLVNHDNIYTWNIHNTNYYYNIAPIYSAVLTGIKPSIVYRNAYHINSSGKQYVHVNDDYKVIVAPHCFWQVIGIEHQQHNNSLIFTRHLQFISNKYHYWCEPKYSKQMLKRINIINDALN